MRRHEANRGGGENHQEHERPDAPQPAAAMQALKKKRPEKTSPSLQMPRMPWSPSSFYASTRTWPFIARAVYRELLDVSWDAGGLPAEPGALREMLGISTAEWRKAWPFVGAKFICGDDGLLRNARLEQHRVEAVELHRKRTRSAQVAAAARWPG